ncbi:hypothetical protein N826_33700 [Skermanella aerolata KACC 11604]|nr:hypothetical protein N826_33700 [Skermanella aerolata KACC 11604]
MALTRQTREAVHLIKIEQRPKADTTKSMILADTRENRWRTFLTSP